MEQILDLNQRKGWLEDPVALAFLATLDAVQQFCARSGRLMRACRPWAERDPIETVLEWFGPVAVCRLVVALRLG